jgi:hypothetical protein
MGWLNGSAVNNHSALGSADTLPEAPEPQCALVMTDKTNGITTELARFMPVMDIEQAIQRRDTIVQVMQRLMKEGVDYGTIPGSPKPALLQPGADKLCNLFGLVIKYNVAVCEEDWSGEKHGGEPFFYYKVESAAYRGEFLIGEGIGSCNSWESKYRWRMAERTCPECNKPNIRKSRDGGFYCWLKTGGCGATFPDNSPSILSQETGRKANPDIFDIVNTVLKIGYKRAKISACINATSAAEFFTQDVEDFTVGDGPDIGPHPINTRAAAQHVAEQKIATGNMNTKAPWKNMSELAKAFQAIREAAGEVAYREELERYGWADFQAMRRSIDNKAPNAKEKAVEAYWHLDAIARKGVV